MVMEVGYEDKMYRQIEKSLSDNINEKLFVPIEMIDKSDFSGRSKNTNTSGYKSETYRNRFKYEDTAYKKEPFDENRENKMYGANEDWRENYENTKKQEDFIPSQDDNPVMSRAEYIRLAREACLRQLYAMETPVSSDSYIDEEIHNSFFGKKKKDKVAKLFQDGNEEVNIQEEIASYKSLIIRTICAVVIFMAIFIIDKVKLNWGNFSYETIKHYVTGYNQLAEIEEKIVSWFK